ncbi:hypothetical protein CISIN_1g015925mg [Citrus sinensis]|uniref:BAG domain-containing protein n=1 Tax=Citrus sinensis TaxID=2711 RepID=A0A067FQJ7_CITSI|nr:hypothetical protein CISIN_1g015925mg [Citrus sinensis]
MRRFRKVELLEPYYPPVLVRETSIFPSFVEDEVHDLSSALDFFNPALDFFNPSPTPFEIFDSVTDLVRIDQTPSFYSYKRIQRRTAPELSVQTLCDRVSLLESRFDRLLSAGVDGGDRKYTWTAEIEGGAVDRKYKWTAEIKKGKKKKEEEKKVDKSYKWTAKIKGKDDESRTYTFVASTVDAGEGSKSEKKEKEKKKEKKKCESATRVVEIEEPAADHGAVVLRQAFAKRFGSVRNNKGKQKELSPQDAAMMIQITFRAYLIRRSQALRALRDLAVAKTKLKEIRALFNNFSYRQIVSRDAEERQRFSEKIIVLLLTVDAIEVKGALISSKSVFDKMVVFKSDLLLEIHELRFFFTFTP